MDILYKKRLEGEEKAYIENYKLRTNNNYEAINNNTALLLGKDFGENNIKLVYPGDKSGGLYRNEPQIPLLEFDNNNNVIFPNDIDVAQINTDNIQTYNNNELQLYKYVNIRDLTTSIHEMINCNLHIESDNGACLYLESDKDNVTESDVPHIVATQDDKGYGFSIIGNGSPNYVRFITGQNNNNTNGKFTFESAQLSANNPPMVPNFTGNIEIMTLEHNKVDLQQELRIQSANMPTTDDTNLMVWRSSNGRCAAVPRYENDYFVLEAATSTTTSSTFVDYLNDSITVANNGIYEITFSTDLRNTNGTNSAYCNFAFGALFSQELEVRNSTFAQAVSKTIILTLTSATSYAVRVQYRVSAGIAEIESAAVIVRRLSY